MQIIFFKESTALVLANTELRALLSDGDTVNKPYRSYLADQAYTKGTDISTFNDLTATNEQLTVDTTRVVPFYVNIWRLWLVTVIENLAICWNTPRADYCKV